MLCTTHMITFMKRASNKSWKSSFKKAIKKDYRNEKRAIGLPIKVLEEWD